MKELTNQILIINGVSVLLLILFVVGGHLYRPGAPQTISDIILGVHLYGFPIFIVSMCLFYQKNNRNFAGYRKSLLIPLSYIIFGFISVFLAWSFASMSQEFMMPIYMMQFVLIFAAVLVVNLVYLFVNKLFFTR